MDQAVICRICAANVTFPRFPGLQRVACPTCGTQVYPQSAADRARASRNADGHRAAAPYHPLERRPLTDAENEQARRLLSTVPGL